MKKTTTARSKRTTKSRKTQYVPVSNNVYHDGTSYRVRVSVDGVKYSKNFPSKKSAIAYRNSLMA